MSNIVNKFIICVTRMDTNRLEAFSDGVFAITITLLVLEIKVPSPDMALGTELL